MATAQRSLRRCKDGGKLGVDHLDLLLHQPLPSRFDLTPDAYRAVQKLLADGKVRAIGVSNFMPEHLERLLRNRPSCPRSTRSNYIHISNSEQCSAWTRSTAFNVACHISAIPSE